MIETFRYASESNAEFLKLVRQAMKPTFDIGDPFFGGNTVLAAEMEEMYGKLMEKEYNKEVEDYLAIDPALCYFGYIARPMTNLHRLLDMHRHALQDETKDNIGNIYRLDFEAFPAALHALPRATRVQIMNDLEYPSCYHPIVKKALIEMDEQAIEEMLQIRELDISRLQKALGIHEFEREVLPYFNNNEEDKVREVSRFYAEYIDDTYIQKAEADSVVHDLMVRYNECIAMGEAEDYENLDKDKVRENLIFTTRYLVITYLLYYNDFHPKVRAIVDEYLDNQYFKSFIQEAKQILLYMLHGGKYSDYYSGIAMPGQAKPEKPIWKIIDEVKQYIYRINRIKLSRGESMMFNAFWDDTQKDTNLKQKCHSDGDMLQFILAIYQYIFEGTKNADGKSRANLPKEFADDQFVKDINELRSFYGAHSMGPYETRPGYPTIREVMLRYTHTDTPPEDEQHIAELQYTLAKAFRSYFYRLHQYVASNFLIEYTIAVDEDGNVCCKKVLLPPEYATYKGKTCRASSVIENSDERTKEQYPFRCDNPMLMIESTGAIRMDGDDCYCGQILLPKACKPFSKCQITVKGFCVENGKQVAKLFSVKINSKQLQAIKRNDKGIYMAGNYVVEMNWCDEEGDVIQIDSLECKVSGPKTIIRVDKYTTREGKVRVRHSGDYDEYYCGNVHLDRKKAEALLGAKIHMDMMKEDDKGDRFPYFCYSFSVR